MSLEINSYVVIRCSIKPVEIQVVDQKVTAVRQGLSTNAEVSFIEEFNLKGFRLSKNEFISMYSQSLFGWFLVVIFRAKVDVLNFAHVEGLARPSRSSVLLLVVLF